MAAGSFNFIGKHEGGLNKKCDFLKFGFSDPLKPNIAFKGAKRPRMGHKGNKDTISAYYRAPVRQAQLDIIALFRGIGLGSPR